MNRPAPNLLAILFRFAQPWSLLAGIIFFALGAGIVYYLGLPMDWSLYWLGQACVSMMQVSSAYLDAHFDLLEDRRRFRERNADDPDAGELEQLPRGFFLMAALTTLTIGAVLTVLLFTRNAINLPTLVILGLAFLLSFFYGVPPLRLELSGYGELSQAFLVANLFPAFAFLLQTGDLHRLLAMMTFPLTALYLAMLLALGLRAYAQNLKYNRRTLLIRLGWQRSMTLHNVLILAAYLLLGAAALLGLPWALTWPGLLSLPVGLFLIWQMVQIGNGVKPRWVLLRLTALALVGLTTYFIVIALWTS